MRLVRIIKSAGETLAEVGLERRELSLVEPLGVMRHAREAVEQDAVARLRHDQAAIGHGAGIDLPPQRDAPNARAA